jgi:hypothetical protein
MGRSTTPTASTPCFAADSAQPVALEGSQGLEAMASSRTYRLVLQRRGVRCAVRGGLCRAGRIARQVGCVHELRGDHDPVRVAVGARAGHDLGQHAGVGRLRISYRESRGGVHGHPPVVAPARMPRAIASRAWSRGRAGALLPAGQVLGLRAATRSTIPSLKSSCCSMANHSPCRRLPCSDAGQEAPCAGGIADVGVAVDAP